MASTYSDLKIELIGTGDQSGTWGSTTNVNLGTAIEEAITGSVDVTFASGQVTLTATDSNSSQSFRNLRLNLVGTSGGAQNLIVPAIEKVYIINNGCADPITVKNSTGTGIAVPAGKTMYVYNNGTNVVDAITHLSSLTLGSALPVSSGGTGASDAGTARTNLGLGSLATLNEVNGATIADNSVSAAEINVSGNGSAGQFLASDGDGSMSWANAAAFDAGTAMLFAQTTAPTGWTKSTTHNNKALRVVSGTASSGGSVAFTTAFASQTPTGSVTITSVTGTAGATTLSTSQIPSHTHYMSGRWDGSGAKTGQSSYHQQGPVNGSVVNKPTSSTGGGGSHTHPFSFSSGAGTFSGTAIDLAVQYVDVIIATKD